MKLPEIDWDKISEISARATELHQSGKVNREIWLGLLRGEGRGAGVGMGITRTTRHGCRFSQGSSAFR